MRAARPEQVLEVARAAARAGGARAAGGLGRARVSRKGPVEDAGGRATSRDLVTEVDLEVQRLVRSSVAAEFPEHAFLGEEDCGSVAESLAASASDDWLWVVDPIDGTTNFVHGKRATQILCSPNAQRRPATPVCPPATTLPR